MMYEEPMWLAQAECQGAGPAASREASRNVGFILGASGTSRGWISLGGPLWLRQQVEQWGRWEPRAGTPDLGLGSWLDTGTMARRQAAIPF